MKTFLSTMKGRIIAGVVTLGVIGAVIVAVIMMNSGYRTIAVEDLNNTTTVVNSGNSTAAYVGQHLKGGDDVTVSTESDLTLALDTDKHMFANEKTHFWIEASGKEGDTRTNIHLAEGSVLNRIDNKLNETENFKVDTPNATMSVRGTVFKVAVYEEANNNKYTVIDVFEGEVFVQIKKGNGLEGEQSRLLKAGERAIVHSNDTIEEFLDGEETASIDYKSIPQNEARFLGKTIDEGKMLCIAKDLLFDYVELNEHKFDQTEVVAEPTCTETGLYYEVCSVCGEKIEKVSEITEHQYEITEEEIINEDGEKIIIEIKKCAVCGGVSEDDEGIAKVTDEPEEENVVGENEDDESLAQVTDESEQDENRPHTHIFDDKWEVVTVLTCTTDGLKTRKCKKCSYVETSKTAATGHVYGEMHVIKWNTETETGLKGQTCNKCNAVNPETEEIIPTITEIMQRLAEEEQANNGSANNSGDNSGGYTEPASDTASGCAHNLMSDYNPDGAHSLHCTNCQYTVDAHFDPSGASCPYM
ncbi:MAG: FecR family protein [Lachnospiraceae bacterium]|nr:FecR family protein [Lachnospiraceae bacterium]